MTWRIVVEVLFHEIVKDMTMKHDLLPPIGPLVGGAGHIDGLGVPETISYTLINTAVAPCLRLI